MYLFPIKIECKVYDNQVAINIHFEEYIFHEKYMETVHVTKLLGQLLQ